MHHDNCFYKLSVEHLYKFQCKGYSYIVLAIREHHSLCFSWCVDCCFHYYCLAQRRQFLPSYVCRPVPMSAAVCLSRVFCYQYTPWFIQASKYLVSNTFDITTHPLSLNNNDDMSQLVRQKDETLLQLNEPPQTIKHYILSDSCGKKSCTRVPSLRTKNIHTFPRG